jgi:hypothetical protein
MFNWERFQYLKCRKSWMKKVTKCWTTLLIFWKILIADFERTYLNNFSFFYKNKYKQYFNYWFSKNHSNDPRINITIFDGFFYIIFFILIRKINYRNLFYISLISNLFFIVSFEYIHIKQIITNLEIEIK